MQFHKEREKILIIDFGSQVTKLIGRNIRELGVYSEIVTIKNFHKIKEFHFISIETFREICGFSFNFVEVPLDLVILCLGEESENGNFLLFGQFQVLVCPFQRLFLLIMLAFRIFCRVNLVFWLSHFDLNFLLLNFYFDPKLILKLREIIFGNPDVPEESRVVQSEILS